MSAMMVAVFVVLSLTNISITQICEIRLTFIPLALCGMMLGPSTTIFVAVLGDILGYLVHPTGPFFPGFTISFALIGLIYGVAFYKRKNGKAINLLKTVFCVTFKTIIIDVLVQTSLLCFLYGMNFTVSLASRTPKIIIVYFIELIIVYFLSITYEPLQKRLKLHK